MSLMKASEARAAIPERAPAIPVEEYLANRIQEATSKGWDNVLIWIKRANFDEATVKLDRAGYKYEQLKEEPNSVQLKVSW